MEGSPAFKVQPTERHRICGVSALWECQSESCPCPLWAVGIYLKDNGNTQRYMSTYYVPSSRFDALLELFLQCSQESHEVGGSENVYKPSPPLLASSIS